MTTTREPLVLVPGLLCTGDLFADQVAAFSGSRPVSIADHTTADNLPAIAGHILAGAPPRFALCGLSMGGYIHCGSRIASTGKGAVVGGRPIAACHRGLSVGTLV